MMKASFRNAATKLAKFDTYVLGISMGSQTHRGQPLEAIVQLINAKNAEKVIVNVADSLRRHTLLASDLQLTERKAYLQSLQLGDQWIEENSRSLENLNAPWEIFRWDRFLEDDRYEDYFRRFEEAYKNRTPLTHAIQDDILSFYRRINRQDYQPTPREFEYSKKFFLEELAVLSIQFEDFPAAQLYPGKELECFRAVRREAIGGLPKGLENAKFFRINIYQKPELENERSPEIS